MQEYWESYVKLLEGHRAMVSFNAGVTDSVPEMEYMYVGFLKLKLKTPTKDGLVDEEESHDVGFVEDRLEMEALRYRVGKYIGRIITNGEVNFIYYLKQDFDWKDVVATAMGYFEEYTFEFGSRVDTEWEVYQKLLFPNVREWQIIVNHNACLRLEAQGDDLNVPRAIEHKMYFNTLEDRAEFVALMQEQGFVVQKELEIESELVKYGLIFYRKDKPFYYEIDELTMQLIDLGESCNAHYDGWESSLVKS